MYKLIAFDCDGTLLNDDNEIIQETIEAIKNLKKRGLKIVLATSRPFCKVRKYLQQLDLIESDQYTVSFNGGYVLNNTEDIILNEMLLNLDIVEKIINFGKLFNLYTFIYERDKIISNSYCDEYIKYNPDIPFYVSDFNKLDLSNLSVYKIIIHGHDKEEIARARSMLTESYKEICEVTSSNSNNLEFVPFGNSKTSGLKCIGNKFNINLSEMVVFGDNENDLVMFKCAGYSVAMGNGIDELKKISDRVTLSNNENGIAKALEEMIEEGII